MTRPAVLGVAAASMLAAGACNLLAGEYSVGDGGADASIGDDAIASSDTGSPNDSPGSDGQASDSGCDGACPIVLATGQSRLGGIAVDTKGAYWILSSSVTVSDGQLVEPADGQIVSCPLNGCPNGPTVLASNQAGPVAIAVSGGFVYWVNLGTSNNNFNDAAVMKCSTAGCGGAPTVLASGASVSGSSIATDGVSVYWSTYSGVAVCSVGGCDGGVSLLKPIDAGSAAVYGVTLDVGTVYWTGNDGMLWQAYKGGGSPTAITSAQSPVGIGVSGTSLVWDEGLSSQSVVTCRIGSCNPTIIAAGEGSVRYALAVDSTGVYWGGPKLSRCPVGGCSAPIILYDAGAAGIALDSTNVYWTHGAPDGGTVMKLAK